MNYKVSKMIFTKYVLITYTIVILGHKFRLRKKVFK